MSQKRILWADDEIEILKPLVLFLESMGHEVETVTNGDDALEAFSRADFDLVLLDENMPGRSGLDVLVEMKRARAGVPMVMVTKSEEQDTMRTALGARVDDFLVKPVSLPQLRVCVTKIFEQRDLVERQVCEQFQRAYAGLTMRIGECRSFDDWASLYRDIVGWELRLPGEMGAMLLQLKEAANQSFCKFVARDYVSWFAPGAGKAAPLFSHRLLSEVVKPALRAGDKVALVVIDNFRLDQWEVIRPFLEADFHIETGVYCSILPTATQYARNAIFAGMLPADIRKNYPDFWRDEADDEDALNKNERELLADYFKRQRMDIENSYYKVGSNESGEDYIRGFAGSRNHKGYRNNRLNALVFNFVDALSHACTGNRTLKDLVPDDAAYRKVTRQWFLDGMMRRILLLLKDNGFKIFLTTDHGTLRVNTPLDVVGPANLNRNLRYKVGKSLKYDPKRVLEILEPRTMAQVGLPTSSVAAQYVFALNDGYFVYRNNRGEYVEKFADSFQHGGVSMEEMILPLVTLVGRG